LEKTLRESSVSWPIEWGFKGEGDAEWMVLMSEYLHEQTGLTAGTIADDDELATDLGHLDTGQRSVSNDKRFRVSNEMLNELM
jgi:hypothetical protein